MNPHPYTFLSLLIILGLLPLLALWAKHHRLFLRYPKTLLSATSLATISGIFWEYTAIKLSVWYYPKDHTLGIWLFGIPLEENLFVFLFGALIAHLTLLGLTDEPD